MTNSGDSPRSNGKTEILQAASVAVTLTALVGLFAWWLFDHGYILYYGDAQAHLNNSRSIVDSKTPGLDQLGTVWLPMLHLICLPFVSNDWLWGSGLAGTFPVAACFVVAGTCFFLAAREAYGRFWSALTVVACFALNPNVLYLASIPMTEAVFLAGLSVALLALLRFGSTGEWRYLLLGLCASWWMSFTRYDGWFLIPFVGVGFALTAPSRRWLVLFGFGAAACLPAAVWMANSWWETSNALDFFNGPYSALAIQGGKDYRGYQNWALAIRYYFEAGRLCTGWPLVIFGAVGTVMAVWRRIAMPVFFLLLTPAFYVWSMHSSHSTPIHVPGLWPFSYYNTRYGIAILAWAAFAAGALIPSSLAGWKRWTLLIPLLSALPWIWQPSVQNWICWKESEQNSIARRAWSAAAAQFLNAHYVSGEGILTGFGDVTGVYGKAGIPLEETLHEGNGILWTAAVTHPKDFHPAKWAVAQAGDKVSVAAKESETYRLVYEFKTKDAPALEIYRRNR